MSATASRYRQIIPLAAAQATGLACGVLGVRWTSAVIPPDLLGLYGLLLGATQASLGVTHQGFVKHIQRTWNAQQMAAPVARQLGRTALRPTLWLAAGLFGVLAILHYSGGVPVNPAVFVWLLVANLGLTLAVVLQTALQAEERYWANYLVSAVSSITRSFSPPLLVVLVGASLVAVGAAFWLHIAATTALALVFLRPAWTRSGSATPAPDTEVAATVRAFAIVGLYGWIAASAARWVAAPILGPVHTGYFVLAGNLTLIVSGAVGAIFLSYSFPQLFARARAGATPAQLQAMTHRTLVIVMVAGQAGLLALAWLTPWLIGPVIAERYAPSTEWLLATGGATLATLPTQFYHNLLLAGGRERECAWLSAISLCLRVLLLLGGAALGVDAFRQSLVAMPWLTLAVEGVCTHVFLHRKRAG